MGHGHLRAWLNVLAHAARRRRRDRMVGLLWAQGSGRKDERAFSDVSATRGRRTLMQNFLRLPGFLEVLK